MSTLEKLLRRKFSREGALEEAFCGSCCGEGSLGKLLWRRCSRRALRKALLRRRSGGAALEKLRWRNDEQASVDGVVEDDMKGQTIKTFPPHHFIPPPPPLSLSFNGMNVTLLLK